MLCGVTVFGEHIGSNLAIQGIPLAGQSGCTHLLVYLLISTCNVWALFSLFSMIEVAILFLHQDYLVWMQSMLSELDRTNRFNWLDDGIKEFGVEPHVD